MVLMSTENILTRVIVAVHNVNAWDLTLFRFLIFGIGCSIIASIYQPLVTFDKELMLYGFVSSSMLIVAKFFIAVAFIKGDTGVVCAVYSIIQVIILTSFNALWDKRSLKTFEIVGLIVCLLGGVVLSLQKHILQCLSSRREQREIKGKTLDIS